MLRYLFIACLLFALSPFSWSQIGNITLFGYVDSSYLAETNSIYAYTYEDHISFREKELAKCDLDAQGRFSLNFNAAEPTFVFLLVDNAKAELVAVPGRSYELMVLAKDSTSLNSLSSTNPVGLEFGNAEKNELNYLMADFTSRYDIMLEDYQASIARKEPAIFKKIDTLETLFKKKYAAFNNPYLNNYIYYTFAALEENITLENKEHLYKKHLAERPVQLNDHYYMNFFNQFYAVTSTFFINNPGMVSEVNSKQNYSSLDEFFKQSKLLSNDTIRETVILKSLSEYFRNPDYKTSAVLTLLDQAAEQCKAAQNRLAAKNLKKKLSAMVPGKPAPAATFYDMDGKPVSLSDYKGKYIYLSFWTSFCAPCTQDMTLIPELKKAYGGKVIFIHVSLDKKQETAKNFLKKNPKLSGSGWVHLYCDNYKKIKEDFKLLTVPTYYLIDNKGNVLRSPAARPADIEPDLMEIKKRR